MRYTIKWIIIIFFLLPKLNFSQNLTSSPYSIFGIGELNTGGTSKNVSMGGTGIGLKSRVGLNNLNPASYNGIDSLFFIYEIGLSGRYSKYESDGKNKDLYDGNLSYISIGFLPRKGWGVNIGLVPYSKIGYDILTENYMQNDNSIYLNNYEGSGGINQLYIGNSFEIFKNVSIGFNYSYLFGNKEENKEIYLYEEETGDYSEDITYRIYDQVHITGFNFDYGIQVQIPINKYSCTIGAVYGHQRELNSNVSRAVYDEDDVLLYEKDDLDGGEDYTIPRKMGIGLSLNKEDLLTVAFDYTMRQWSEIEFENSDMETQDSHRFSFGAEYSPRGRYSNYFFKSLYYRVGGYYNRSYLYIDNVSINSMALTFGVGIPIKRNLSVFNIAFEMGKNGTLSRQLVKENFYALHINVSLQDIWFMKSKYQ